MVSPDEIIIGNNMRTCALAKSCLSRLGLCRTRGSCSTWKPRTLAARWRRCSPSKRRAWGGKCVRTSPVSLAWRLAGQQHPGGVARLSRTTHG